MGATPPFTVPGRRNPLASRVPAIFTRDYLPHPSPSFYGLDRQIEEDRRISLFCAFLLGKRALLLVEEVVVLLKMRVTVEEERAYRTDTSSVASLLTEQLKKISEKRGILSILGC